jgi:hypothetical protein
MPVAIPSGIIPVASVSTSQILYGDRTTSYRWEVLTHASGVDTLYGYLDGVVDGSATISGDGTASVKLSGTVKVDDIPTALPGFLRVRDLNLTQIRLRPVLVISGLPEIPLGVYLVTAAPEDWTTTGRVLALELHERTTVLDQDAVDSSYTVDTVTPILAAVAAVVALAGESITVDATVTSLLTAPMVWPAGTSKLQIANDLLAALNYNPLWTDGVGNLQATPYIVPANRSVIYELLNVPRILTDGPTSIYEDEWTRDKDNYSIPNKVVAVQSSDGTNPALVGIWTNTDPTSPYSYVSRGNRWITSTISDVQTPVDTNANMILFLQAAAQASLIAQSSPQAMVQVKCLPVPIKVGDIMQFANTPAGINQNHVVTSFSLDATPLGLLSLNLQEVISL